MNEECIIADTLRIVDALRILNDLSDTAMTLFVVDNNGCMVGTLTDGDIRRALIGNYELDSRVRDVMFCEFAYIDENDLNIVSHIHELRNKHIKLIPVLDSEHHIKEIYNIEKLRSVLPIDVVVMAGGKGERLRPLTEKTPKPLLPVGDKAIIDYNIERLVNYGVRHINVTVNYLHEQIEDHFSKPIDGIKIDTALEPEYLGTMGSIRFVKQFYNDVVLVMNSDLFTTIDYEDFYLHFTQHHADMSVAAVPYKVSIPYGIFDVADRNIHGLIEKPTYTYYANAGIYLFKRSLLELIPEGEFFNATDFIELLINRGLSVIRYPLNGTWIDIGTPQEYQKANDLVRHFKY